VEMKGAYYIRIVIPTGVEVKSWLLVQEPLICLKRSCHIAQMKKLKRNN